MWFKHLFFKRILLDGKTIGMKVCLCKSCFPRLLVDQAFNSQISRGSSDRGFR